MIQKAANTLVHVVGDAMTPREFTLSRTHNLGAYSECVVGEGAFNDLETRPLARLRWVTPHCADLLVRR
jgi:hypothetical protein